MGVKSTFNISRDEAEKYILENIFKVNDAALGNMIEDMNDGFYEDGDFERSFGLHNFRVINDLY